MVYMQVIKVGSSSIIRNGEVDGATIDRIAGDVQRFKEERVYSTLVVSGAIRFGMRHLGYHEQPQDVLSLQRCAGVGQPRLMNAYLESLERHGLVGSQLLVTMHDLHAAERQQMIRERITDDIDHGIVTLVNYNDGTDTRGIVIPHDSGHIRDNDPISALIAEYIGAQRLVIITNSNSNGLMGGRNSKEYARRQAERHGIEVIIGEHVLGPYALVQKHNL